MSDTSAESRGGSAGQKQHRRGDRTEVGTCPRGCSTQQVPGAGRWLLTAQRLASRRRAPTSSCLTSAIGHGARCYWVLGTWLVPAGCRVPGAGCRVPGAGVQLLGVCVCLRPSRRVMLGAGNMAWFRRALGDAGGRVPASSRLVSASGCHAGWCWVLGNVVFRRALTKPAASARGGRRVGRQGRGRFGLFSYPVSASGRRAGYCWVRWSMVGSRRALANPRSGRWHRRPGDRTLPAGRGRRPVRRRLAAHENGRRDVSRRPFSRESLTWRSSCAGRTA